MTDQINGIGRAGGSGFAFNAGGEDKTVISMKPNHSIDGIVGARGTGLAFIAGDEVQTLKSIDFDYGIGRDPGFANSTARGQEKQFNHSHQWYWFG